MVEKICFRLSEILYLVVYLLLNVDRDAFSKPSKESYDNKRYKYPVYSPNRQVLPRSSYYTDFLKYGIMPTFDCKQLGMESLPANSSLAVKTSSYQV